MGEAAFGGGAATERPHPGLISLGSVGAQAGDPVTQRGSVGVVAGLGQAAGSRGPGCWASCRNGSGSAGRPPISGAASELSPGSVDRGVAGPCLHFPTTNQEERQVVLLWKCPSAPGAAGRLDNLWICKHASWKTRTPLIVKASQGHVMLGAFLFLNWADLGG